ncbi:DUF3397 domain-containing protein [Paenibacillus nicotianae]|uniref:DUF3397 domain-containing protein n=1 Tax=Paenibacillus nicotianae TaxID=1526551 RepID=A0ABW4UPP9_9BACL
MGVFLELLLNGFIFLSLVPFIPFVLTYVINRLKGKEKKPAISMAMDVTTPFLYISVAALFNNTFNTKTGFYIFLLILLLGIGLIGGAQNRLKGKVDYKRLFRAVWRVSFLLLSIGYIALLITGILQYITQ